MAVVNAKYTGENNLKGYVTGKKYELIMNTDHPGFLVSDRNRGTERDHGGSLIRYATLRKFLDNWEVIK